MTDILEQLRDQSLQLARRSFDSVDAGLAANVADAAIDEIEKLRERLAEETKTVSRVWAALGITTFSQAGGLEISEIVAQQRDALARVRALLNAQQYENDVLSVGQIRRTLVPIMDGRVRLVDQNGTDVIGAGPACASCGQIPTANCRSPSCNFRSLFSVGGTR